LVKKPAIIKIFMATHLFPTDGGLGGGAIAGIVIGVLVAVVLVAVLAFFLVR
jgi:tetrahydromethanopterin S-methyltransferase subunit F